MRLLLDGGRRLLGTVSGVSGDVLLTTTYSRIAPKHRIAAWVRLLAVIAAHPERELSAVTVGRAGREDVRVAVARVPGEAGEARRVWATETLGAIIDLRDRGMREPLPLFCETSAAYAEAARGGRDPVPEAEQRWKSEFNSTMRTATRRICSCSGASWCLRSCSRRPGPRRGRSRLG